MVSPVGDWNWPDFPRACAELLFSCRVILVSMFVYVPLLYGVDIFPFYVMGLCRMVKLVMIRYSFTVIKIVNCNAK